MVLYEKLIEKLCRNGFDAYLTGGAVRDLFLGKQPFDHDIVTNGNYRNIEEIFSDRKVSTVGKSFQVCIVDGIEISGYRKDTYFGLSDKNCTIEPAETIYEDLARRDLTINAMAFCPYTGDLIDPYNGMTDLNNKIIRFVGNPSDRIYEDPCRIVRACRFLSKLEGTFSDDTFESMKKNVHLLQYISKERFRLEIMKSMKNRKASIFFESLYNIGGLSYIFPSLADCYNLGGGKYHNETVFEHNMIVGDSISTRCSITKLAGYLHDVGKPNSIQPDGSFKGHDLVGKEIVIDELKNLKFSNNEVDYISSLIRRHMFDLNKCKPKTIRKFLSKINKDKILYSDWLRLKFSDRTGNMLKGSYQLEEKKNMIKSMEVEMLREENISGGVKELDISGNDIMNILNINQGPEVGYMLNYLYEVCINYPEFNNNNKLKQIVMNWRMLSNLEVSNKCQ